MNFTKSVMGHLTLNLCFASCGLCGSRSAVRCARGAKHRRAIFHVRVGLVRISQKARRYTLHQTCVFHQVAFACHVMHSVVSGVQKFDA
jgi:hypothetical protein